MNDIELSGASDELVEHEEGCLLYAYDDADDKPIMFIAGGWCRRDHTALRGNPTIGIGTLLPKHELPAYLDANYCITREMAENLLRQRMEAARDQLRRVIRVPLNSHQQAAALCACYNCPAMFASEATSTVLRLVNAGATPEEVKPHWLEWNKSVINGVLQKDPRLVGRRTREWALFTLPVPEDPMPVSQILALVYITSTEMLRDTERAPAPVEEV